MQLSRNLFGEPVNTLLRALVGPDSWASASAERRDVFRLLFLSLLLLPASAVTFGTWTADLLVRKDVSALGMLLLSFLPACAVMAWVGRRKKA